MNCYICESPPNQDIPLLRCGHYVCCECYCRIKSDKINVCLLCEKKLIRGRKLNKIENHLK